MNHLIIFAHPNSQKSFGRAIVDRIVKASQQLGVETHLRDLYTMEFNPIISFEELQSANKGLCRQKFSRNMILFAKQI